MNKYWRQPIPTQIFELQNNPFAELVFQSILLNACNLDQEVKLKDGTIVFLKRGDCLFGRFAWNEKFSFSKNSQKIERLLKKSPFLNNNLNIKPHSKYTIITIQNYNEWISFEQQNEQQVNNRRTTDEQQMNTSESVKSVESVKNRISIKNTKAQADGVISDQPKKEYGNPLVIETLTKFKEIWGYSVSSHRGQTDRKQAWNFVQKAKGLAKDKTMFDEKYRKLINSYFKWVQQQTWGREIISIQPLSANLNKFIARVQDGEIRI